MHHQLSRLSFSSCSSFQSLFSDYLFRCFRVIAGGKTAFHPELVTKRVSGRQIDGPFANTHHPLKFPFLSMCGPLFGTDNLSSSIQARWFGRVFFYSYRESFFRPSPPHDVFYYKQAYVRTFMKDRFISSEAFLLPCSSLLKPLLTTLSASG
ncbi:hypothetical protein B0H12DRAFT_577797 [Mycena haematopus]|nr:hypothetical protein B0H12DRAFT_577797 [Mycena haematopus]